jgi:GNAT superfamily N-acetyltransferase
VAVDDTTQQVIGTTAVRPGGPKSPPHPAWLAERYDSDKVAQLFRVYISAEHRRRGVARALVDAARQFVADEGSYAVIYLHTNPASPGAEAFWRSMPTTEIYDGRTDDGPSQAVHFELAFPEPTARRS